MVGGHILDLRVCSISSENSTLEIVPFQLEKLGKEWASLGHSSMPVVFVVALLPSKNSSWKCFKDAPFYPEICSGIRPSFTRAFCSFSPAPVDS